MSNVFKTKNGTELPLIKLKGKDYLQVAHRLVWFEEQNINYDISTQFLQLSDEHAVAKATVIIFDGDKVMRKATATKQENKKNFADYIEKAETGSIGRALAMLGYGTQFTGDELDEGARLADSPVDPVKKAPNNFKRKSNVAAATETKSTTRTSL